MWIARVYSQSHPTAFGLVTEMRTAKNPIGIISGDFNGDGLDDLSAFNQKKISLHLQTNDSVGWHTTAIPIDATISNLLSARCNGDRLSDVIVATVDPDAIQVYLAKASGSLFLRWSKIMDAPIEHMIAADINNDGNVDLILYGKKALGITVFPGYGNGTFRKPTVLLPDVSFSNIVVTDMNHDRVNDVIGISWLTNEVRVYSGFGKTRFTEPVILSFPDEPMFVSTAHFNSDLEEDLVVGCERDKSVRTFLGNGLGEFAEDEELQFRSMPDQIEVRDLDEDGRDELITIQCDERSLSVRFSNEDGGFEYPTTFTASSKPENFVLFTECSAPSASVAVLNEAPPIIRILKSTRCAVGSHPFDAYALGIQPRGIVCNDLNRDGWNDVFIANSGSQDISLLANRKEGGLSGQVSIPTLMRTSGIHAIRKNDSTIVLLGTHPQEDHISITELSTKSYSHVSYSLFAQDRPDILSAGFDASNKLLTIFTLSHEPLTSRTVITKFDQIAQTRFIEHSITPHPRIINAIVGDVRGNGRKDVTYAVIDRSARSVSILQMRTANHDASATPKFSFTIPIHDSAGVQLWSADFNNDGLSDLLVNLQRPESQLLVSLEKRDSMFAAPQFRFENDISISSRDRLKIADIDSDGNNDIILDNDVKKNLEVYFGKGDGTFTRRNRLMSSITLGGFALCDLDHDGHPEFLVTDSAEGILKLIQLKDLW